MKRILSIIALASMLVASCQNYDQDIESMQKELDAIKTAATDFNSNMESLQQIVNAISSGDKVESITPVEKNGAVAGYTVKFKNAGSVTVYNNPAAITVGEDNGSYYWKTGSEWLKDADGNRIGIVGENAAVPQFKIENDNLLYSVDNGANWSNAGSVAKNLIESVTEDAAAVYFKLAGGQTITLPKEQAFSISFSGCPQSMKAGETATVTYSVTGATDNIFIRTYTQAGWKAVISETSASAGTIAVTAPDPITEFPVLVLLSDNKGKAVVTAIPLGSADHGGDTPDTPDTPDVPDEPVEDPVLTTSLTAYEVSYEGGDISVTVSTNLDYTVSVSEEWIHAEDTKAVREDVLSFFVDENDSYESRTATITFAKDSYSASVVVLQEGKPGSEDPSDLPYSHDLSANGIANCYIVIEAGDDYSFECKYYGNGQDGILECEDDPDGVEFHTDDASISSVGKPAAADVIWQKDANNQNTTTMITDVKYDKDKKVITFKSDGTKGNAIIGVYDKYDELLWSWHIWCTEMPKSIKYYSSCYEVDYYVMDRNLGATSCDAADGRKTFGAHYQWGRKDPFLLHAGWRDDMVDNPDNSLYSAITMPDKAFRGETRSNDWMGTRSNHTNHYLWGNCEAEEIVETAETVKTIYDPCPAGYMVPSTDVFQDLSPDDIQTAEQGFYVAAADGQQLFFPYAGIGDKGDNGHTYDGWYAYWGESPAQSGKSDSICHGTLTFSCWFNACAHTFGTGPAASGSPDGGSGMSIDTAIPQAYSNGQDIAVHISPNFIDYWGQYFSGYLRPTLRSVRCVRIPSAE